jgi:hypothetical protein
MAALFLKLSFSVPCEEHELYPCQLRLQTVPQHFPMLIPLHGYISVLFVEMNSNPGLPLLDENNFFKESLKMKQTTQVSRPCTCLLGWQNSLRTSEGT